MRDYLKKYDERFYKTKRWKDKRKEILTRDNFECQLCKDKGGYSKASVVHHIKHYQTNPSLALTNDNLISLCFDCHNEVHPEKLEQLNKLNEKKKKYHKERWE